MPALLKGEKKKVNMEYVNKVVTNVYKCHSFFFFFPQKRISVSHAFRQYFLQVGCFSGRVRNPSIFIFEEELLFAVIHRNM